DSGGARLHAQRALGAIGRDIGGSDIDPNRAVHIGDEGFAHAEIQRDVLAGRDAHAEIGGGLEPIVPPAAGNVHFVTFIEKAMMVALSVVLTESAVIPNAQRCVPASTPVRHHDNVGGINDAQRLTAAQRSALHIELRRVRATARQFHGDVIAWTRFDAQLADEIVNGDRIAFQDVSRSLRSERNRHHEEDGNERQRASDHSGSTRSWIKLDSGTRPRVAAFTLMKDWLVWFLLAIGLFVGEMFTAGFWLACLAVGAAVAGVVGLIPGLGFVSQGLAFAVASIVSMAGLRPRLMHLLQLGPGSDLRTGVDALLGKTGIVTERIGPGSAGRVKVDGEDWRGASSDATVIEPGTPVTIIQVDGTTLLVEKEL